MTGALFAPHSPLFSSRSCSRPIARSRADTHPICLPPHPLLPFRLPPNPPPPPPRPNHHHRCAHARARASLPVASLRGFPPAGPQRVGRPPSPAGPHLHQVKRPTPSPASGRTHGVSRPRSEEAVGGQKMGGLQAPERPAGPRGLAGTGRGPFGPPPPVGARERQHASGFGSAGETAPFQEAPQRDSGSPLTIPNPRTPFRSRRQRLFAYRRHFLFSGSAASTSFAYRPALPVTRLQPPLPSPSPLPAVKTHRRVDAR